MPQAAPGELIVSVGAALTCGTDLKVFRRGYHARMIVPPALFGHELAGTVVEAGEEVRRLCARRPRSRPQLRAPAVTATFANAGRRISATTCSSTMERTLSSSAFPARIVSKNTLHVPDHVPLEHAALTDAAGPALCTVSRIRVRIPETRWPIIGGGPLGLMILHVAALAGCKVIAIVKHDGQVEAARQLGAAHVVQTDNVRKRSRRRAILPPKSQGVDIAIEAVGVPETWQEGCRTGAQRRHGEFLRRLCHRHAGQARYQPHSL